MRPVVSIVKCDEYQSELVLQSTRHAFDLIGGIAHFIQKGSSVLIKPNLALPKIPERGITTHPEIVRAVITLLKELNCKIYVGDSPGIWDNSSENVNEVYLYTGIKKVCDEEKIELVKFEQTHWRGKIPLTTWLDTCDYLINIPKFKTHRMMRLTGSIKNLFGLVPGILKKELHLHAPTVSHFADILVDIYNEAKPTVTLVDGIVAMEESGLPFEGRQRKLNLLLCGTDGIAIDSIMAHIMGIAPLEVATIRQAIKRGIGTADIQSMSIVGEHLKRQPFVARGISKRRRILLPLINSVKRNIKNYPYYDEKSCIRCLMCFKICPTAALFSHNGITFDYTRCCSCNCCAEVCPTQAIRIKKSPFNKMLGL